MCPEGFKEVNHATRLQVLIDEAQQLPPLEQLNLIRTLLQSLYRSYEHSHSTEDFWAPRSLDELVQSQRTEPVTDISSLKGDFWPEDKSTDNFLAYIYQQRCEHHFDNRQKSR